jgi:hypothetical protein
MGSGSFCVMGFDLGLGTTSTLTDRNRGLLPGRCFAKRSCLNRDSRRRSDKLHLPRYARIDKVVTTGYSYPQMHRRDSAKVEDCNLKGARTRGSAVYVLRIFVGFLKAARHGLAQALAIMLIT